MSENPTLKTKSSRRRVGCLAAGVLVIAVAIGLFFINLDELLEIPSFRRVAVRWIGISPVITFDFVEVSTETTESGEVLRTFIARNWVYEEGYGYFCRARFETLDSSSDVKSSVYADLNVKDDGGVVFFRRREIDRDDYGVFAPDTILRDAALQSSEWSDWTQAPRGIAEAFQSSRP